MGKEQGSGFRANGSTRGRLKKISGRNNCSRRRFLLLAGSAAGVGVSALATRLSSRLAGELEPPSSRLFHTSDSTDRENLASLVRMQHDVHRALEKPIEQRRWAMAIDVRKCIGCRACVIACKAENVSPPGVSYRHVSEVEVGEFPDVHKVFMPTNCMQCDDPPCMKAAPPGAITKRPDGIVVFHYEKLQGKEVFGKISAACPYTAITYDEGRSYTGDTPASQPYEQLPSYDYGQRVQRKAPEPPVGSSRKCDFCLHRLEVGMLPACVTTCIGSAMYFGDLNDPDSLIAEVVRTGEVVQINEPEKWRPYVWHLAADKQSCAVCHE